MNIAMIHGSERKGSTYHIAKQFLQEIDSGYDLCEFFLPKDMDQFCKGCCNCIAKGERFCPHFKQVEPIRQAMEAADLIIFTTPVYVMRASGQVKTLLDHFPFLFMTHRPRKACFLKQRLFYPRRPVPVWVAP